MTAEEARKITVESKSIMDKIKDAAFKGESKITVFTLTTTIRDALKKLGYHIKSVDGGINETNYEISW
jgi:hypothetical protein